MRSNRIFRFIALVFLAILSSFNDDGVNGEFELDEGEADWLLVNENLNCLVKGEQTSGHEQNPNYCWATKSGDEERWPLCYPAESDEDIPEWLEDIVKVDNDGV